MWKWGTAKGGFGGEIRQNASPLDTYKSKNDFGTRPQEYLGKDLASYSFKPQLLLLFCTIKAVFTSGLLWCDGTGIQQFSAFKKWWKG